MTFDQAKQRPDYEFHLNDITKLIGQIQNNYMEDLEESSNPYQGIATLIIGYVDIEVNLSTREQCIQGANKGDRRPVIDYFVCVKWGKGDADWESDDYLDHSLNVDWNSCNWAEQLEKDMFYALDRYVIENGYSYDHPNKTDLQLIVEEKNRYKEEYKMIDYDKLALSIINEYESDRQESGRKELVKGMRYILSKYKSEHDREIIDQMLMTFTGWSLNTLLNKASEIPDCEIDY